MLRGSTRRRFFGFAALGAALALSACNDTAGDFNPTAPPRARAPAGVPVALVSLSGAPETVISRLSSALSTQAARRDITIVGIDGKPRYQVRGYLAASALSDGKAELSWAFDIYDSQRRRAKRFSGEEPMRGGQDWSVVSDQQLQTVAFKALDEIAEFLAASPEAVSGNAPANAPANAARRAAGLVAAE